jgi:hypothetical protein
LFVIRLLRQSADSAPGIVADLRPTKMTDVKITFLKRTSVPICFLKICPWSDDFYREDHDRNAEFKKPLLNVEDSVIMKQS